MCWMLELMAIMFVLMFSETERLKNEIELHQQKQEIILKLEQIMRQYDNLETRTELENTTPYVIPEIKSRYDIKKDVDK